jgi:hypothetical protein
MGDRVRLRALAATVALAVLACTASVAAAATVVHKNVGSDVRVASKMVSRARPTGIGALVYPIGGDIGTATEANLTGRTTTLTGSISTNAGEWDDVYAIFLIAGEQVDLSMIGDSSTDFGFAVFDQYAIDVYADTPLYVVPPFFYGGPDTYPLDISFKATYTGVYYLNAYTWVDGVEDGGSGSYSIDVTFGRAATLTTIDSTYDNLWGEATQVSGSVAGRFLSEIPQGDVTLLKSYDGVNYVPMESQTLGIGGYFAFADLYQFAKTYYLVQFEGDASFSPSASHRVVNNFAWVSGVSAKRYGTRSYRLSGMLRPLHAAGHAPVRVYLWKYVSGHYKAMGYRNATANDGTSSASFTTNYKFPSTGKWRLRAYHADSDHLGSWSTLYSYVTVK